MKRRKSKTKLLHQYYRYTGFYTFIGNSLKKSAIPVILIIFGLYLVNEFVFTIDDGLEFLTQTFSRTGVLIVFFISETLLGLIPPEIFIGWSKKNSFPNFKLIHLSNTFLYWWNIILFYWKNDSKNNYCKKLFRNKDGKAFKKHWEMGWFFNSYWSSITCPFFNYMCSSRNDKISLERSCFIWSVSFRKICIICMGNF